MDLLILNNLDINLKNIIVYFQFATILLILLFKQKNLIFLLIHI